MTLSFEVVVSGWAIALLNYREALLDRLLREWLEGTGFLVEKLGPARVPDDYGGAPPRATFIVRDPQGEEAAKMTVTECEVPQAQYVQFFMPLLIELRAREHGEILRLVKQGGSEEDVHKVAISIVLKDSAGSSPQTEAEMLVEQIAHMAADRVAEGKKPEGGRVSLMRLHGLAGKRRDQIDWDRMECEAANLVEKLLAERNR